MSYKQAQKSACADDWEVAVQKELQQLIDFKTCEVIKPEDIPAGKNITGSKIVFKTKLTADGNIEKRKCRIVALGYSQIYGVDYLENFSPTPMIAGIRLVIIFILHFNLKHGSGDVTGAFLNSDLKEEIYMRLPDNLTIEGSNTVKLKKSLYGLKQAAREWNETSHRIIMSFDPQLKKDTVEPCIYYKVTKDCTFILSVHVDDYIIGYNNQEYLDAFIKHFNQTCEITWKPNVEFILQMKLEWSDSTVTISQNRQIEGLVRRFNQYTTQREYKTPMDSKFASSDSVLAGKPEERPEVPYRELVCAMLFIARYTRPDILYAVTVLCRYLTNYTTAHWKAAIRILVYLKGTTDIKLVYKRQPEAKPIELYTDSDYAGDIETRRSTSGGIILAYGNLVTWFCEKQAVVTKSTTEAEYIALYTGISEACYFINVIQRGMGIQITPIPTHVDNQGTIFIAQQEVCNKRTKHIDVRYHFCREQVKEFQNFELFYVPTCSNLSDIMTKALNAPSHEKLRDEMMKHHTGKTKGLTDKSDD